MKRRPILILWLFVISISCNSAENKSKENEISKQNTAIVENEFNFIPLEELKYNQANINPGTEVEILANLNGPENRGDTVFYYQFIFWIKEARIQ